MDIKKDTTASRFRDLRKGMNRTQAETAESLGISLTLYSRIENGHIEIPSTPVLIAAADLFCVSVDYLLCRTDAASMTGLSPEAIQTLTEYQKTAAIDKQLREQILNDSAPAAAYNLLADTVSFLLAPQHCEPNKGGLLHLIGNYIISDDIQPSADLPAILQTENYNGSGLQFNTAEVIRASLPNMIVERLHEYRADRLRNRKKKSP